MKENKNQKNTLNNKSQFKSTKNSTDSNLNDEKLVFDSSFTSSNNSSYQKSLLDLNISSNEIMSKEEYNKNMENLSKMLKNNFISTPIYEDDIFNSSEKKLSKENLLNDENNVTKHYFKTKEEIKEKRKNKLSTIKKNKSSDFSSLKTISELKNLIGSNFNINSFQFQISNDDFKSINNNNKNFQLFKNEKKILKSIKRKGENENKEEFIIKKKRHLIKKINLNNSVIIYKSKEIIFDLENQKEEFFGINNRYSLRHRIPKLIPFMGEKIEYVYLKKDSGPSINKIISTRLAKSFKEIL
jgi:hypothetical protein